MILESVIARERYGEKGELEVGDSKESQARSEAVAKVKAYENPCLTLFIRGSAGHDGFC